VGPTAGLDFIEKMRRIYFFPKRRKTIQGYVTKHATGSNGQNITQESVKMADQAEMRLLVNVYKKKYYDRCMWATARNNIYSHNFKKKKKMTGSEVIL
jgi:hypothetical protein